MKVKDVIKEFQKFDPEMDVMVEHQDDEQDYLMEFPILKTIKVSLYKFSYCSEWKETCDIYDKKYTKIEEKEVVAI